MSSVADYQDPHCSECARLRAQVGVLREALVDVCHRATILDVRDSLGRPLNLEAAKKAANDTTQSALAHGIAIAEREREACLLAVREGRFAAEYALGPKFQCPPHQAAEFKAIARALGLAEERIRSRGSPSETREEGPEPIHATRQEIDGLAKLLRKAGEKVSDPSETPEGSGG